MKIDKNSIAHFVQKVYHNFFDTIFHNSYFKEKREKELHHWHRFAIIAVIVWNIVGYHANLRRRGP